MDRTLASFAALAILVSIALAGCCCCVTPPGPDGGNATPVPNNGNNNWNPLGTQAEWTYLVYLDGDNNLEEAAIADFLEMERVGSGNGVNVVVQMDRGSGYYSGEGDWSGARRFLVQRGDGQSMASQYLQDLGETDMADPNALYGFVSWGIDNYPANKYALVVWNHGGGWTGMLQDETSGNGMYLPEMKGAFSRISQKLGKKLDVIVFDMCLMGQYEVAIETAPYADYMVASEETVPGYSFDYSTVLNGLEANSGMGGRELAELEVQKFREFYEGQDSATTLSAYDLATVPALETAFDAYAQALATHVRAGGWKDIAEMHQFTEGYPAGMGAQDKLYFSFGDLYDFAQKARAYSLNDSNLDAKALGVQGAINQTVIANYHHALHPESHGISYYFQPNEAIYQQVLPAQYARIGASNKQAWKDFLSAYYAAENTAAILPSITNFKSSRSASLVRPLKFSYSMQGNNIVANEWAQFNTEGGELRIARLITQRMKTTLSNGEVAYGFPGGEGVGQGSSSAIEFFISDGTRDVRASVQQKWPAENLYALNGHLQKSTGEQADAQLNFYDSNGSLAYVQVVTTGSGGQPVVGYFSGLDDGDQFTPYVYVLAQAGIAQKSTGETLTYRSPHGFTFGMRPLSAGTYTVADILTDIANQTGYATADVSVSRQPVLNSLTSADLRKAYECGQIEEGMRVQKLFVLNLTGGCTFEDAAGAANCTLTYSEEGAPHIYLNAAERFETYKFLASRLNGSAFWLFSLAGEDPVYCAVAGSGRPSLQVYRDLYNSVGDYGEDLAVQRTDEGCLYGDWESDPMEFTFEPHGQVAWTVGGTQLSGAYSAENSVLTINTTHPSPEYSASFYYLCSDSKLVLYDQSSQAIRFHRPGEPFASAPNDPVASSGSGTPGATPYATPTPPSVPAGLVGVWQNQYTLTTLLLDGYGQYTLLDGYSYYFGAYSADASTLTLNYAGNSVRYTYRLSGNTLTLAGSAGTLSLTRVS